MGFSVTASGEGTLTYQWYHGSTPLSNGGDISGATSDQLQMLLEGNSCNDDSWKNDFALELHEFSSSIRTYL